MKAGLVRVGRPMGGEVRLRYSDPEYIANRRKLLRSKPLCIGYPEGVHGAERVLATTADHREPLSAGGTHDLKQLDPMCGSCNSRKGRDERRSVGWRGR